VSISAPRYASGPVVHVGRTTRALAIFQRELLRRATWGPLLAVALTWLVVVLAATFNIAFASLTGSSVMSGFESPYESVAWILLILIVAATVGAGSLADDIGSRAITLYLSRPINLSDYLVAKAGATGTWLLIATVGPGCVAVAITTALGYVSASAALAAAGAYFAVGVVTAVFFTGVTLAFSSVTRRSLYAGVATFGAVLSIDVSTSVVSGITGNTPILYANPKTLTQTMAEAAFGLSSSSPLNPYTSAAVMIVVGVVLAALAWWRLARIEVVGE